MRAPGERFGLPVLAAVAARTAAVRSGGGSLLENDRKTAERRRAAPPSAGAQVQPAAHGTGDAPDAQPGAHVTDPLQRSGASAAAVRGGGLRMVAWCVSAVLSLVSLRLLVEHLGVPGFGRYVAVLAVVNMAVVGSDLGITALALRDWGALEPERRGGRMFALLRLRFALAAAAGPAAIAFAAVLGWPAQFVAGTAIASIAIFGLVIT